MNIVFGILFGLILAIWGIIIQIVLILVIARLLGSQSVKLKNIYSLAIKKFPNFLILMIVLSVIIYWIPRIGLNLLNAYEGNEIVTWVLLIIASGWIVFFSLRFLFVFFAFVIDDLSIKQSFDKSKEIVWRNLGEVLIKLFLSIFLIWVLSIAAVLLIKIVIAVMSGNLSLVFSDIPFWWKILVVDLVAILVLPLFVMVGVLLYKDLGKAPSKS